MAIATGGTITTANGRTIHTFTTSGSFIPSQNLSVDYLIVAGGDDGGATNYSYVGAYGGPGGQVVAGSSVLNSGSHTVTVGNGNQNSSIDAITATHGAGAAGGAQVSNSAGLPGTNGTLSSISGTATYYGGGGGSAGSENGSPGGGTGGFGGGGHGAFVPIVATSGLANTGGGGGGGNTNSGITTGHGYGGSGIVIISYVYGATKSKPVSPSLIGSINLSGGGF